MNAAEIKLRAMASGYQVTQLLCAAMKLRLPDLIGDHPVPLDTLAHKTGCTDEVLYRLLRALSSHGIFVEKANKAFASTPLSELMSSGSDSRVAAEIESIADFMYAVWGQLPTSLRSSKTAFEHVFGATNWEYRAKHPEENAKFNRRMAGAASQKGRLLANSYAFPGDTVLVDVGGGSGALLREVLSQHAKVKGVVFDQPHVFQDDDSEWPRDLLERCTFKAGDFFESVPADGDFYILAGVLHDWDDHNARRILQTCRAAMKPRSRMLIVEFVVPSDNEPHFSKMMDLYMFLTNVGGRERTLPEWSALVGSVELDLEATMPLGAWSCLQVHAV